MKKIYSTFVLALVPFLLLAQSSMEYRDEAPMVVKAQPSDALYDYKSSGNAFWEEDFANGFPAGWATDNPDGYCPWKWSMNGSHGFWNGNDGLTYGDSINSTTAGNGFLIADNDSANHFEFGQPSGTTYQYLETYFVTSAIDLSTHPAVKLEFEQNFRFNNDLQLEVMVSNDSLNWTTWYVEGSATNNNESENPELVGINISSVAGSQSTVYLKIGWSARVYFWMIDDMRIVEAPNNDLVINSNHFNEWFFDTSPDFSTLEFGIYPNTQLRPLQFKSIFTNDGILDQSNVTIDVEVFDDSQSSVYTDNASMALLPTEAQDSLSIGGWVPPMTNGRYTVEYNLSADDPDAIPSNNFGTRWFEVSDYIFARDTGGLAGNYDNEGEAYELGTWYNIQNPGDMLYAIDVAIDDASDVGTTVYGVLYDGNRDYLAETEEYEIQAADLNAGGGSNFVNLLFDSPVPLDPGEDYLVMVGHFGGADNVFIGTSGASPPQSSLIYDQPVDTWFWISRVPMVRMNLNAAVGIEDEVFDHGISIGQNYPNPFSNFTAVNIEVDKALKANFEIHDITGKVVYRKDLGILTTGRHIVEISSEELNAGVYFYSLVTDEHTFTKRMNILAGSN